MLVLTRSVNESVVITTPTGQIEVTVAKILGNNIRLGFTAPKEFIIMRKEIMDRRQQ